MTRRREESAARTVCLPRRRSIRRWSGSNRIAVSPARTMGAMRGRRTTHPKRTTTAAKKTRKERRASGLGKVDRSGSSNGRFTSLRFDGVASTR
jgi:hypothetical protein